MAADARRRMGEQEFEIYAEGNALRRVERVAEPREIERPAKKPINVQARKNRARAMELTALHAAVLLAATLVVGIFCCQLLLLQSQVIRIKKDIRQTQSRITECRTLSDSLEDSMKLSMDLDYVYRVATQKLGMVYPTKEQVIRFDRTELEYVRQFEEIPIAD